MVSKSLPLSLTALATGILACALLFAFAVVVKEWYLTATVAMVLLALSVFELLREIVHHRNVSINAIQLKLKGDFNNRIAEKAGSKSYRKLARALNALDERYTQQRETRALEQRVFALTLQEMDLGVVLLRENSVFYKNQVATPLLNLRNSTGTTPYFFEKLEQIRREKGGNMLLDFQGETEQWKVNYKTFKNEAETYELFLFKNQQYDAERMEEEISTRLMHVLTHEIMNSVSPINSLINSISTRLQHQTDSSETLFEDVRTSVEIIQRRSQGLMDFVKRYNLLAHLPKTDMSSVSVSAFTEDIKQLVATELQANEINFLLKTDYPLRHFRADRQLLTQVILNLIKNAIEAFEEEVKNKNILLSYNYHDGYHMLAVIDNAGGVPADIEQDIFLPFFSTKNKASGIGLSLSRKIMQAHGGRLYVKQLVGGAEFRAEWAS